MILHFYYFMDKSVRQTFIYRCVFPSCLCYIYSQHRDSPQAQCNGKVLQCLLQSGLGRSESKTMKDKAVSTPSVPQLCLALDSLYLVQESGSDTRPFLTAFKLQFRAISVPGQTVDLLHGLGIICRAN